MTFPKPNNIVAEKYVAGMSLFKSKLAKIKLSANESALGPSPKAKKEYIYWHHQNLRLRDAFTYRISAIQRHQ